MREFLSKFFDKSSVWIAQNLTKSESESLVPLKKENSYFHRFRRDESGVIAVFFVLAAMPLLYATALAVNYTQASKSSAALQDAADAAALASVSPRVYNRTLSASAQ
jgi:Flp pilus assembly protein TadG